MASDLSTADAAMKEFYEPALQEELPQDNVLLSEIATTSDNVEGRRVVLSLHTLRNSGIGARALNGNLPTAGQQGYVEERVTTKRNYGTIQIDGELIRSAKSDRGAFIRAVDNESSGVVDDLKRDYNRQLWGTSDGVIAQCGVTTAAQLVVLAAATPQSAANFFDIGMVVDIGTAGSSASIVSAATITAVDTTAGAVTITIDSAVTTTAAHFVTRSGSGGSAGSQKEITGLQSIVDSTGTLFNVNPSTSPSWKSYEDATGGNPTEIKFQKGIHSIRKFSGKDIELILTTDGVYRGYYAQLQSRQRIVNTKTLDGGFEALTVAGGRGSVPITWDRDCPDGQAFGLNKKYLKHYTKSGWEFMKEDGAVLSRVAGKDAYGATLFIYSELATTHRNTHGKWTNLNES